MRHVDSRAGKQLGQMKGEVDSGENKPVNSAAIDTQPHAKHRLFVSGSISGMSGDCSEDLRQTEQS